MPWRANSGRRSSAYRVSSGPFDLVTQMTSDRVRGEEELIREFLAPLVGGAAGALGLSDDCALFEPLPGRDLVLKTDPVIGGVHFFLDDDPADIAWKALAVNVSDLAAKGARPEAFLMTLAFPQAPARDWMRRFAEGVGVAQAGLKCPLLGGDTDHVPGGRLSIGITVIGSVAHGCMVRRGGARPGDRLFVSGTIGEASIGLRLRKAVAGVEPAPDWVLSEAERAAFLTRYLRPQPRLGLAPVLREFARAAMDLSDGLVKDAVRMCRASGVDAMIEGGRVPLSGAAGRLAGEGAVKLEALITAGDDYEILAAVAPENCRGFEAGANSAEIAVREIGVCSAGTGLVQVLGPSGEFLTLAQTGWDHFG